MVGRDSKVDNFAIFCCWLLLGRVFWPRLDDPCVCQSPIVVCYFLGKVLGCAYTFFFVGSNSNFLHIFQWITLPSQLCLVLYYFCAYQLHSLMWLMVSSLPPHSLHLLFCCVWSIPALICLVLMELFCAAIRRDSVSLLKFPFLSQVQVLLCEMLFISLLKHTYSCFSFHFCFLIIVIMLFIMLLVSFLMVVISPPLCFSLWS